MQNSKLSCSNLFHFSKKYIFKNSNVLHKFYFLFVEIQEMNRSWDFTGSTDGDDEYEEESAEAITIAIASTTATTTTTTLTAVPLLTFHPSQQEKCLNFVLKIFRIKCKSLA